MHRKNTTRWVTSLQRSFCFCAVFLVASLAGALRAGAQDVAETARKERARRAAQPKQQRHVYTNDDLKRSQILTQEDRALAEAGHKKPILPQSGQPVQSSTDAVNGALPESLGEIARRYRRQKIARDAEEALRSLLRSPYHMDLPKPSLGALSPLRVPPISAPAPVVKTGRPGASIAPLRRDPFARPPLSSSPRRSNPGAAPTSAAPLTSSRVLPTAPTRSLPFAPPRVLPSSSPSRPAVVTIQAGDSLWKLARRHLGSGGRWPEWLADNPGLPDPHRIRPGTILVVPQGAAPARASPASPSSISLRKGDSLWKIASTQLGRGAHWVCLARANPGLRDINRVYPGQTLIIPAACPPVPLRVPMR